jgi:integrase
MATIQKLTTAGGEVRYRVQIRMHGHPPQSATFPKRKEAEAWAEETSSAIRDGRHFHAAEAKRRTFDDLVAAYLDPRTGGTHRMSERERVKRTRQLGRASEALGKYSLAAISTDRVERFLADLAGETIFSGERARIRSITSVHRYRAALRHAFRFAVRKKWLRENPVAGIELPPEPKGRVRFLDDAERARLLQACRDSADAGLYPLVLLAISTGARQAELLALRWRDVDMARRVATLQETKNGDRRIIAITGPVYDVLAELRRVRRVGDDRVFPFSFPRKSWEAAIAAAGISNFRYHDLRHCTASYMAQQGASLLEIAEILGHKTLAVTQRYAHLTSSRVVNVSSRMTSEFLAGEAAWSPKETAATSGSKE